MEQKYKMNSYAGDKWLISEVAQEKGLNIIRRYRVLYIIGKANYVINDEVITFDISFPLLLFSFNRYFSIS